MRFVLLLPLLMACSSNAEKICKEAESCFADEFAEEYADIDECVAFYDEVAEESYDVSDACGEAYDEVEACTAKNLSCDELENGVSCYDEFDAYFEACFYAE